MSVRRPAAEIREWLRAHIAGALGVEPGAIDVAQPFQSFGLGSVDAVVMSGDLASWLEVELPPTLLWDHPTIEALAQHLGEGARDAGTERAPPAIDEPVAIVGMACRFPGAPDVDAFWRLLVEGRDAVTSVPSSRWSLEDFYDPDPATPGKMSTRWGGFVEGIEDFDPGFFGIPLREAKRMDPQQRMLLELAWEAFESAGIVPRRLAGSPTGVFVGITASDHGQLALADAELEDAYLGTGNALSIVANRLSYHYDLQGPSLAVDTACSSSLVAVHLACRSLASGESTLAIAAGVNLLLNPALTVNFSKAGFMAPDGRCRPFDAAAGGYVRGEGAGLVVLEPLARAIAAGRRIRAVIPGSAVNQDGRSNGLTAPNRLAQERVLQDAYRRARVSPGKVQYVEAHGTGTPLGDPIEARALGRVLSSERPAGSRCRIGSVKSNIGHLEGAAGIAGLMKVTLALEHGQLPPSLHFTRPNPHIPFDDLPLAVNASLSGWAAGPRIAGVSSFGFGGTNAHVVVQEAPPAPARETTAAPVTEVLLLLSGHVPAALQQRARQLADWLASGRTTDLPALARTLALHRAHLACRRALVVTDVTGAIEGLRAIADGLEAPPSDASAIRAGAPGVRATGSARAATSALALAGERFERGEDLAWDQIFPGPAEPAHLVDLPPYPWQRQRCWILTPVTAAGRRVLGTGDHAPHSLLGSRTSLASRPGEDIWSATVSAMSPDYLDDHRVQGVPVLPAAGFVEMALQAARELGGPGDLEIRDLRLERAVALPAGRHVELQTHGIREADGGTLTISQRVTGHDTWLPAATARWIAPTSKRRDGSHSPATEAPPTHEAESREQGAAHDSTGIRPSGAGTARPFSGAHSADIDAAGALDLASPPRDPSVALSFPGSEASAPSQHPQAPSPPEPSHPTLAELHSRCPDEIPGDALQKRLASLGLEYRAAFRSVKRLWRGSGEALGELDVTSITPSTSHQLHPAVLDSAFQCLLGAIPAGSSPGLALPVAIASARLLSRGGPARWVHARLAPASGDDPAHLHGDLILLDEAGRILAEVTGLELKRLEGGASTAPRNHLHRVRWKIHHFDVPATAARKDLPRPLPSTDERLREALQRGTRSFVIDTRSWTSGSEPGEPGPVEERLATLVTSITRLLTAEGAGAVRLWIVTRGAVSVHPEYPVDPAASAIWAFAACAALEAPGLHVTLVDDDTAVPPPGGRPPTHTGVELRAGTRLADLMRCDPPEDRIALRRDGDHIARLEPLELADLPLDARPAPPREVDPIASFDLSDPSRARRGAGSSIRPHLSYLVTGGLGALGLLVARWLVERGASHLLLAGRRAPDDAARRALDELRARGASIEILQADVADADAFEAALEAVRVKGPPLAGVFHAAGVLEDRSIPRIDRENLARVLRPKVSGAWNLHRLTESLDLDHFVLFSSVAATVGSPGQGAYGGANGYLDGLAALRRASGLPGLSIAWGPWTAGMAGSTRGRGWIPGILPLEPAEGLEALGALLESDVTDVTCWKVDAAQLGQALATVPPLLRSIVGDAGPPPSAASRLGIELRAEEGVARRDRLVAALVRRVASSLGEDPGAVTLDTALSTMGVDSLMTMELQQWVRSELGVELPTSELLADPSLERLVAFLLGRLGGGEPAAASSGPLPDSTSPASEIDLAREITLPEDIEGRDLPRALHQDDFLLTGATGYLGAYLLAELIASTRATIHCLVRAPDEALGMNRIRKNLEHYRLWRSGWEHRIRIVPGDLGRPRFGLAPGDFEALSHHVDAIFHAGAWVNFAYAYPVLEPANVGGTREILRLAATGKLKRVHMVSTLGMLLSTEYPKGYAVDEDLEELRWRGLANGYEQTKYVADRVAALGRARGIPVNIYRVGLLSGECESGAYWKWDDFFPSWIKGCVQLGSIPQLDTLAEMVPVDHVSRAIVAIARQPGWINRTFHLKHDEPIPLGAFADVIERLGHPLERLPFDRWKALLLDELSRSTENALHRHLFFLEMLHAEQSVFPRIGTANARAALEGTGLTCPPAATLLERYFKFFLETGFIAQSSSVATPR